MKVGASVESEVYILLWEEQKTADLFVYKNIYILVVSFSVYAVQQLCIPTTEGSNQREEEVGERRRFCIFDHGTQRVRDIEEKAWNYRQIILDIVAV